MNVLRLVSRNFSFQKSVLHILEPRVHVPLIKIGRKSQSLIYVVCLLTWTKTNSLFEKKKLFSCSQPYVPRIKVNKSQSPTNCINVTQVGIQVN